MSKELAISQKQIESRIFSIRNNQVMIDRDLAEMYQVEVKRLNEQVKRNIERFPESFRFQLTEDEKNELVANCDRFETLKHSSNNPYAFTEQGVAMLSAVLRSETAIKVSIQIMGAFVEMRKILSNHSGLLQRMEGFERKQIETDQKFEQVFKALESKDVIPTQGVFFDGQIFDA
jgi:2,3-bisphosphoglycerate-independent phosphoglycerate mutase